MLRMRRRLAAWTRDLVSDLLGPLGRRAGQTLSPAGRGLLYQLEQSLGTVPVAAARDQLDHLTEQDREELRELKIVLGRRVVFLKDAADQERTVRRAALCAAYYERRDSVPLPAPGEESVAAISGVNGESYLRLGLLVFGPRAIRAEAVERIDALLRERATDGPFRPPEGMAARLGCTEAELARVLGAFGYRRSGEGLYERRRSRRRKKRSRGRGARGAGAEPGE
jgi:ATP-dependent RNA helicase SUPV3L1/SUV3